jgi:hypothetical protein
MAAITVVRPMPVQPVGYEVFDKGTATEAIPAGAAVIQTAAGWSRVAANATDFHGLAARAYYAGEGGCDFMVQGEMDGYSGLTPGANVFVSPTVAGGLDTAGAAGSIVRARAVTATRIRVNCV